MKLNRLEIPHSIDCFAKDKKSEWAGVLDGEKPSLYGNFVGNENAKRGVYHLWYRVMCNDPKCPAIKLVHSSVLRSKID